MCLVMLVEHWIADGTSPFTDVNQTPNGITLEHGSQTMWAKLCSRKGNSPDRPLRSLNLC